MEIRDVVDSDWAAIWGFMQQILAAGGGRQPRRLVGGVLAEIQTLVLGGRWRTIYCRTPL